MDEARGDDHRVLGGGQGEGFFGVQVLDSGGEGDVEGWVALGEVGEAGAGLGKEGVG